MHVGVLLWLVGCPAKTGGDSTPTDPTTPEDSAVAADWCGVEALFERNCVVCHQPANLQGGLDLDTDPHQALVGVTSATYGVLLVAPGDPAGSLLFRKVSGTQGGTEGASMPTTGPLQTADQDLVAQWITDGADGTCGAPTPTDSGTFAYHPPGWADPAQHGLAANLQTEGDCVDCHGALLDGGSTGVACASCHAAGWETNCTFCHGGVANSTGAPPEDMDGEADPTAISFPPHTEHVDATRHLAYDCVQCHNKPLDALSPGHLFADDTPGEAEIDFAGGLAAGGDKVGETCTVYCHGNGRGRDGVITITDGPRGCNDCHVLNGLAGHHEYHLQSVGLRCDDCHPDVNGFEITDPELHVNGARDVDLPGNMIFDGTSCSGICHFERHQNRTW